MDDQITITKKEYEKLSDDSNLLKNAIAMFPECKIELIYFENNPEKCYDNVKFRNDNRNVSGTIERFRKIYSPPQTAIKIWRKQ